ncbi:hypothetical protein ISN76_04710 [Dyella halodurans]|uniref:Uncharacterized protein n=1 Tax=Dyella halodurans TaxID=1920171 RepID=A0ABV9C2M3_9GAMM|nr:hypothetical protein [Dyella halodurans]
MRWAKIIGLLVSGSIVGGLLSGYVVFEYMKQFGIDWDRWASSQYDELKASDALGTVAALSKMRAGNIDGARGVLEWRLTGEIPELAAMKRAGRDPGGYTTKAITAIREDRRANPWASGNQELDKLTSDALGGVTNASGQAH